MRTIIAIFLSVYLFAGSLIPGNSFANFSKLPALFRHYISHSNVETPGISFAEFLVLHYTNNAHEKSDAAHHRQLPLHQRVHTVPVDQIIDSGNFEKLFDFKFELNSIVSDHITTHFPSGISHGIFHPPKG